MHIYAFGSVVRGEIDLGSDIDLIALVDKHDSRFDPGLYSIYSYNRLCDLWEDGNPFAWHLATESRMIFSDDGEDYIKSLGKPAKYRKVSTDCKKFYDLFLAASSSIRANINSAVFELSTIFLAIRNFATCYSLGYLERFDFSRFSAKRLGSDSIPLSDDCFSILERARILSTRGTGTNVSKQEVASAINNLPLIQAWMEKLLSQRNDYGRV